MVPGVFLGLFCVAAAVLQMVPHPGDQATSRQQENIRNKPKNQKKLKKPEKNPKKLEKPGFWGENQSNLCQQFFQEPTVIVYFASNHHEQHKYQEHLINK